MQRRGRRASVTIVELFEHNRNGVFCGSTVALRVVGGDVKGTQSLGAYLGHPVPGGYKYGDLALHVGGVSNLRQ
jgi:hypothetical protein